MSKKIIIPVIVICIFVAIMVVAFNTVKKSDSGTVLDQNKIQNQEAEGAPASITLQDGDNVITGVAQEQIVDLSNSTDSVKEVTMTSFYEVVDGKPKPQYSIKKIIVNKGDLVKIKVTVTKGMHDFKIDEFNVYTDTKELNKEYIIEFTADKAGEFIYYCTKTGHRVNGHWGVLAVKD